MPRKDVPVTLKKIYLAFLFGFLIFARKVEIFNLYSVTIRYLSTIAASSRVVYIKFEWINSNLAS